jgi:Rad3-related DNA helicase
LEQARRELETCGRFLLDGTAESIPLNRTDLKDALTGVSQLIQAIQNLHLTNDNDLTKPGSFMYDLFLNLNANLDTSVRLMQTIDYAIDLLSTKSRSNSRYKVSVLSDALKVLFNSPIATDPQLLQFYRVYIKKQEMVHQEKGIPRKVTDVMIHFWCFSSAIAMREVASNGTRTIIVASGTLSPLGEFAQELGLSFPHRVENSHVIKAEQLMMAVVSKGPNAVTLTSTFQRRDSNHYMSDLGYTIMHICESTPDGVLCFFTSYGIMQSMIEKWKKTPGTSIWSLIVAKKDVYIEPKSKNDFSDTFSRYEQSIQQGRGAIFFAVCRGKASEGIDFSNSKARAVIICGIPFPASKDPKVTLKRRIMNDNSLYRKPGDEWYALQAYRAVNQAIGRVIRHRNDFGAVLLCDERFGEHKSKNQLSKWVRPYIQTFASFDEMITRLGTFFTKLRNRTTFHEQDPLQRNPEGRKIEVTNFKQNLPHNNSADPLYRSNKEKIVTSEPRYLRARYPSNEFVDPLSVKKIKSAVESIDPLLVSKMDANASIILQAAEAIPDERDPLSRNEEGGSTSKENQDISVYLKKVNQIDLVKSVPFQTRIRRIQELL